MHLAEFIAKKKQMLAYFTKYWNLLLWGMQAWDGLPVEQSQKLKLFWASHEIWNGITWGTLQILDLQFFILKVAPPNIKSFAQEYTDDIIELIVNQYLSPDQVCAVAKNSSQKNHA